MEECPYIYGKRLQAVRMLLVSAMDTKYNINPMVRGQPGNSNVKNKVKEVDRLEGNKALYEEISSIYFGLLVSYLSTYLHNPCRIITTHRTLSVRKKLIKPSRNDKAANNAYRRSAQEP